MNTQLRFVVFRALPSLVVLLLAFFLGEYVQKRSQPTVQTKQVITTTAPNANIAIVSGTIKSTSGESFQLTLSNGKSTFIGMTSATAIQQTATLTPSDLAAGQKVLVTGTYINQTDIKATNIVLSATK